MNVHLLRMMTLVGFAAGCAFGQSNPDAAADRMLTRLAGTQWSGQYAAGPGCQKWIPWQMALSATDQWSFHCAKKADGLIEESFFYVFDEPNHPTRLRVDLRPEDESVEWTAALQSALSAKLSARFGPPSREPEMAEIGFRHLKFGQPVSGEHWHTGRLDYLLHSNLNAQQPMGVRKGVELIVIEKRLMGEQVKDAFLQTVDNLGFDHAAFQERVLAKLGLPSESKPAPVYQQLLELLRRSNSAQRSEKALLLLGANSLVDKLSILFTDEAAAPARRQLAAYGVKLGSQTHDGGLSYNQDLLWRVWREFPDTEAGELAFVELQHRGWSTGDGSGCPPNPDLFRDVITHGETFLNQHPGSPFRIDVLFTLAIANESWWSIAHAPADDEGVNAPPYPRRALNQRQAAQARDRAIQYYRQLIELAPDSPEAASARRRLPRIESGLDTGQRRFFCTFC